MSVVSSTLARASPETRSQSQPKDDKGKRSVATDRAKTAGTPAIPVRRSPVSRRSHGQRCSRWGQMESTHAKWSAHDTAAAQMNSDFARACETRIEPAPCGCGDPLRRVGWCRTPSPDVTLPHAHCRLMLPTVAGCRRSSGQIMGRHKAIGPSHFAEAPFHRASQSPSARHTLTWASKPTPVVHGGPLRAQPRSCSFSTPSSSASSSSSTNPGRAARRCCNMRPGAASRHLPSAMPSLVRRPSAGSRYVDPPEVR
jgi:hypothetical protein